MIEFNDRRDFRHLPNEDDYERPLTRNSLAEANARFRHSGIQRAPKDEAQRLIEYVAKRRSRAKHRYGQDDFSTVGEYLEYLNQLGDRHGSK